MRLALRRDRGHARAIIAIGVTRATWNTVVVLFGALRLPIWFQRRDTYAAVVTKPSTRRSDNRLLYQRGERYLCALDAEGGRHTTRQLKPVADANATSVAEVRTAVEFVSAVKEVVDAVGPDAKDVLLSGANILLTPTFISTLSRRAPQTMEAALLNAANGLHPMADPSAVGPLSEFGPWAYYIRRLQDALRCIEVATVTGRRTTERHAQTVAVHRDATAIRVVAVAGLKALQRPLGERQRTKMPAPLARQPKREAVARARKIIEGVVRDLALVMANATMPAPTKTIIVATLAEIHDHAQRLVHASELPRNHACARVVERSDGPDARPGTYVVVMRLPNDVVLRIGRLGTFWLPKGYLLYVGSAMGGGGVRSRTNRHQDPSAVKLWNVDHVKAVARPVEIWWTHDTARVECDWAMALASMHGYCCPTSGFGANDCKACPAHFFHRSTKPECDEFAGALGAAPARSEVLRQRVLQRRTR